MQKEISGFWRRTVSFVVDIVILGVLGMLLGMLLSQQLVALGAWGRAVGFVIAALYFGLLNSRISNGQTVGKRLLGIQVVDRNGQCIGFGKSLARYSIMGIPFFLNGAQISVDVMHGAWSFLLTALIFGLGLSLIYLFVFNRNTRQSLHDLLVGTYVIRTRSSESYTLKNVWRFHYAVCGVLLVASLLLPIVVNHLSQNDFFTDLLETQNRVQSISPVAYVSISDGKTTFKPLDGEATLTTYLQCSAQLSRDETDNELLAARIADTILATYEQSHERHVIHVGLSYGYDIGIASFWKSSSYSYTPDQWKEKINAN